MPIYEFRCKSCEKVFEVLFFSISEKREVLCPDCNSDQVEKLMSVFGGTFGGTSSSSCSSCSAPSCTT
ncbi:putative regulatory protein, FmdB family [Syntrophus gentianae]|uniref:Putative regulatory protein, FmdB family n=1 Tax=Syntrophus gentianae TaxID=43775 RepID=A0A1H7XFU9_9BACT|nr:putative regulatory protein, FmdB family [Syntrophus gentianae]